MRRRTLLAGMLSALAAPAVAQGYPDRPIRLIVPAAPGGPTDIPARLLSQILPRLGQPAVVENRPGAGGAIGARAVATAAPDGYTLLIGNTSVLAVIPGGVGERRLRSGEELRAGREDFRELPDPRGASVIALEEREGIRRRRESQSGQVQCRAHRRRAACRISPPSCSSRAPASTSSACPTRAAAKR